jgi:putative FmdB family regulatory protein
MPAYDYHCLDCDHIFEITRHAGKDIVAACPACGSQKTHQLMCLPHFQFKGTGFYTTDYQGSTPPPGQAAAKKT